MNQPVSEAIAEHITPTLSLAILAQVIAILLAIPFGIIAAYKRGSIADYTLMGMSLLGMALPSFCWDCSLCCLLASSAVVAGRWI